MGAVPDHPVALRKSATAAGRSAAADAAPANVMSKLRHHAGQPDWPIAAGIERRAARIWRPTGGKGNFQPPRRDERTQIFRPFDQRDAVVKGVLDVKLPGF